MERICSWKEYVVMPKSIDITGQRFGKLVAIKPTDKRNRAGNIIWQFQCHDLVDFFCFTSAVKQKKSTKSCGCTMLEYCQSGKMHYKHGMEGTTEYNIWLGIKQRCLNENHARYKYYGGRGITVCAEWLDFEKFYSDMGKRPDGLSIDRINNDKGYFLENCRWATPKEQANNRRKAMA